jgi:hypothetical protein
MADTLGAGVWVVSPDLPNIAKADLYQAVLVSQSSASNTDTTITITPPNTNKWGGYIRIIAIFASYVAAADTGKLDIVPNTKDAVIARDGTGLVTITAAQKAVIVYPFTMQWDFSCVSLAVTLRAGGSNIGNVAVAYKLGY